MKRKINKGFTLIELMIVIAIIGVLSVVLIPKALPMRNQAKDNAVQANVLIVRSLLENRAGADKTSIENDIKNPLLTPTEALDESLRNVQSKIKIKMVSDFATNKDMKNPFSNNTEINSNTPDIKNNNPTNSSVVIGYETASIPTNVSSINNTITTPGLIAVIVYQTGYVVYGVDNLSEIVMPTIVNMPTRVGQLPGTIVNPLGPQVASPTFNYTFDNEGGSYAINCLAPDAKIRYTIDGHEPNSASPVYTAPIPVKESTTIKAYAYIVGVIDSNVVSTTYAMPTIPILTPSFSFSGNYGVGNTININSSVIFSVTLTPATLVGTMVVTADAGSIQLNADGSSYTFTAPNLTNKICTITAIYTTSTEQFVGKQVLKTN